MKCSTKRERMPVKAAIRNVEFRLGEIENLPVADNVADIIISNCVINLSPDKGRVFEEAFRILKPGGRLMVSDIVLLKELPAALKESVAAYTGCIAGALMKDDYLGEIGAAGFQDVRIINETLFPVKALISHPAAEVYRSVAIPWRTRLNSLPQPSPASRFMPSSRRGRVVAVVETRRIL